MMLKRFWSNDDGVIAPVTVFFLILLLGFCAFVLDVGTIYAQRRALQNAADAAALAGAKEVEIGLLGGDSAPASQALSYAARNGVARTGPVCPTDGSATVISSSNIPGPLPNSWQVDTSRRVKLTFAPFLGISSMCVSAHAVAVVTDVTVAKVWPWGILGSQDSTFVTPGVGNECNPGNLTTSKYCFELKEGAGESEAGNFGILDFPVNGSCVQPNTPDYNWWALNGYGNRSGESVPGPIPSKTWSVCTTTGNKSASNSTIESFITTNTQNPPAGCAATDPPDLKCPLVGLVPILKETHWPSGHSGTMTVVDFAIFRLVAVTNALDDKNGNGHKEIVGEFLKMAEGVGPTQKPDPNGTLHNAIGIRLWQ